MLLAGTSISYVNNYDKDNSFITNIVLLQNLEMNEDRSIQCYITHNNKNGSHYISGYRRLAGGFINYIALFKGAVIIKNEK
jgi:hypothetical protein